MEKAGALVLRIATRRSRLALWQAEHIRERLLARHPGLGVELLPMSTRGDELLDVRLDRAGGKGLFVQELETALLDGRAELAVHSMKDMPVELAPEFTLAAITAREDPRDAFVANKWQTLAQLPAGANIGTSSLRRAAQISERFPALRIVPMRGNVETRIAKLDRGEHDALVLAAAGLKRLGLASRIGSLLEVEVSLPAAGQGALGIECRADRADVRALLEPLAQREAEQCVRAERAVNRALGGNCSVPLGAYAMRTGDRLRLRALVASSDGRQVLRAQCEGPASEPEALGRRAAAELLAQGAAELLASLGQSPG